MTGAGSIGQVGEFAWLARVLPRIPRGSAAPVGPGQDCAVVRVGGRKLVYTVDALVEGTHFEAGWLTPRQVGRKAFAVNASDVAAMGGTPRWCVVALAAPAAYRARDLTAVQAGIVAAARGCGAAVVGGNLTRAPSLCVTIALLGDAPRHIVTRRGARPGDAVYVTGTLGDAALALAWLQAGRTNPPPACARRRFATPTPRLQAGRRLAGSRLVSAMIDISDGLLQDLGHVCEQSGVGAEIEADRVPRSADFRRILGDADPLGLWGGEDYELLFTVPEHRTARLSRARPALGCPITRIGHITRRPGVRVFAADGRLLDVEHRGYDHFRAACRTGQFDKAE